MSLLDKATIITTPTAHSEGKLHSIKGGSIADFDVVRGSAATRVNAEGLIEDISTLSGELVTNGDFATDSDWGLAGGSPPTITNNKLNLIGDTYNSIASNVGTSLVSGKTYKVSFEITDYTSGGATFRLGGVFGVSKSGLGVHTQYIVSDGATIRLYSSENGTDLSLTNVSVKEVVDATNIPRIDYTDGTASILLEPQTTNLVTYSEDFSMWTGLINLSIGLNEGASPSGEVNANLLSLGVDTSSTRHRLYSLYNFILGNEYTFSVFAKKDEQDWFQLMYGAAFDTQSYANFDLANGVVGNVGTSTDANIIDYGNGWYRCSITCTATAAISSTFEIITTNNTNSGRYPSYQSTTNTNVCFLWGAQLEQQSYSTSYIPTSGAIATRLADTVTGAGSTDLINSTEGVLYAEIAAFADDGTLRNISISDGTYSNTILLRYLDLSNKIQAVVRIGNSFKGICDFTLADTTENIKVAYKWKNGDFALWINGTEVDTSFDIGEFAPNILTELSFDRGDGTQNFYGKTKAVAVWKEALSDEELTCLTTI